MQAEHCRGRDLLSHTAELLLWTQGLGFALLPPPCTLQELNPVCGPDLQPTLQGDLDGWGILRSQGFRRQ